MPEFRRHAKICPPEKGMRLVAGSVGPDGELVTTWAHDPSEGRKSAAVVVGGHTVRVPATRFFGASAQPMPGGNVLLVAHRARSPEDDNATVYNSEGVPIRSGHLGDGIEHAYATRKGDVWVGYFDEGVYGDSPVSRHGVVRFGEDLKPAWTLPPDRQHPVDDCYALNVTDKAVWGCYYSGFPLLRVDKDGPRLWKNTVHGAKALAVGGDRVAFYGGYRNQNDRLVTCTLKGDALQPGKKQRLERPAEGHLVGRGPELHLVAESVWYRVGLEDLG